MTEKSEGLEQAEALSPMILEALHRSYPHKVGGLVVSEASWAHLRDGSPLFRGCWDWHSSVHSHWALLRILRAAPRGDEAAKIRTFVRESLSPDALARELCWLEADGMASFELPYGMAWLLSLAAELHRHDPADFAPAQECFGALESLAALRFEGWITSLRLPLRSGQHGQSAFAMSLVWDWAVARERPEMCALIGEVAQCYFGSDRRAPLAYEPSAYDFLSPILAEACCMARVLEPAAWLCWLEGFWPESWEQGWRPLVVQDPTDAKQVHGEGLNLSRAWMLHAIARRLPRSDPRVAPMRELAAAHGSRGLAPLPCSNFAASHWLGSFAIRWIVERDGLDACERRC